MADNVIQYLLQLKDQFSAGMQKAGDVVKAWGDTSTDASKKASQALANFQTIAVSGFEALTGDYSKIGDIFRMIPGPVGEAAGAIAGFAGQAVEKVLTAADAFDKLSQKTGASVEFLSGFTEAADDVRISSDKVATGLEKFSKALGGVVSAEDGAVQGGKPLAQTLEQLNISATNADGSMRKMEEILPQVADLFMQMPDGAQKTALAVQLFGRAGADLIPILNKGSVEIRSMMGAAKEMGTVIDGETVESMKRLKDQQDAVGDRMKAFEYRIAKNTIPALQAFTQGLNEFGAAQNTWLGLAIPSVEKWGDAFSDSLDRVSRKAVDTGAILRDQILERAKYEKTSGFGQDFIDPSIVTPMATATDNLGKSAAGAAKYEKELATSLDILKAAAGGVPKALDDIGKLQAGIALAGSGDRRGFEVGKAGEAITLAVSQGKLTAEQGAEAMGKLRGQAITVEDAFKIAGAAAAWVKSEMKQIEALGAIFEKSGKFPEYAGKASLAAEQAMGETGAGIDTLQTKVANLSATPVTLTMQEQGYDSLKTKYDALRDKTITVTIATQYTGRTDSGREQSTRQAWDN